MRLFLRFCMVGAIGFVVDGGILTLLTHLLSMGPIRSRVFSFSAAMLTTWLVNRTWAFRDRSQANVWREFTAYASTQLLGLAVNFGLYTCLILYTAPPFDYPLPALCIATSASLTVNFVALVKLVFPQKAVLPARQSDEYTGTDNLEVMSDAKNYNGFLVSLVLAQADRHMKVVDYGAGIGTFAQACSEHGLTVHCVEPDKRQSEVIRAAGISVSQSLAEVPDASVDLLYALNVLEHIEHDEEALHDIHIKLKPGGRLLIYVPAFQVLYSSMDKKVGHYRRYRRADLARKARAAGFLVLENIYVDSLGFVASLLYKVVGHESGSISRRSVLVYDRLVFPLSRLLDRFLGRAFGKNVYLLAQRSTR